LLEVLMASVLLFGACSGLLLVFLVLEHVSLGFRARRLRRRESILQPILLRAIAVGNASPELDRGARRSLGTIRSILVRAALDFRGDEAETIGRIAENAGVRRAEERRLGGWSARVRAQAALNLGALRARSALPRLLRATKDRSKLVRLAALRAIGDIGDQAAVASVLPLLDDPSPSIVRAVQAILVTRSKDLLEDVLRFVRDTRSSRALRAATEVLAIVRRPESTDVLLDLLEHPDPEIRIKATRAGAAIGDPRFLEPFQALLGHSRWELRCQAARGLGVLGCPSSVPLLRAALKDGHWRVRLNAAASLASLGDSGLGALREALGDKNDNVRSSARYVLERSTWLPGVI
jgi:HEAT repeat protein